MIARYATACGTCSQRINPGQEIVRLSGSDSRWVHASCRGRAEDAAAHEASATSQAAHQEGSASPEAAHDATEVYTDGACSGNPGPGGWAWAVADGRQASGAEAVTTNQRMEIQAALEAVRSLRGPLVVVSDSTYVVKCFKDGWWRRWRANNWVTSAKKPVANRDLWEPLIDLVTEREDVTFRWVKGHSGNAMNDLADQLAVAAGQAGAQRVNQ